MKNTMQELKKIDFTKCKLPKWWQLDISVRLSNVRLRIVSSEAGVDIISREYDGEWQAANGAHGTNRELLNKLFDIAETVDKFITDESDKIAREEWAKLKPEVELGYELCNRVEAIASGAGKFNIRYDNGHDTWCREWGNAKLAETASGAQYVFSRPIKKVALPQPSPGDGFELCDKASATEATYRVMGEDFDEWRLVGFYAYNLPHSEYFFRRPIAKKAPPIAPPEGYELCTFDEASKVNGSRYSCRNKGDWDDWSKWCNLSSGCSHFVGLDYAFCRPIAKPVPFRVDVPVGTTICNTIVNLGGTDYRVTDYTWGKSRISIGLNRL
jgi:hypothetical protein